MTAPDVQVRGWDGVWTSGVVLPYIKAFHGLVLTLFGCKYSFLV